MESHHHANRPNRGLRKAIPATCGLHRGPIGFANLMVSLQGESVVLDPHVTGSCVTLDEQSAKTLRDLLTQWLGRTGGHAVPVIMVVRALLLADGRLRILDGVTGQLVGRAPRQLT
jgi:hypothetical protein